MDLIERATILHFHRHRIAAFGEASTRSLGWRDDESQRRRFQVIADAADFTGASVLDVGCGRGDLKRFLDRRFDGVTYLGIDHMPAFVEQARAAYRGEPRTTFVLGNFDAADFPEVDYVVASGALGYRSAEEGFHLRMIRKMWEAARRAVVVNLLDGEAFPEHPLLVGRDREEVMAFCRELTPSVELVRGYQPDDFTVCLRRSAREKGTASADDDG